MTASRVVYGQMNEAYYWSFEKEVRKDGYASFGWLNGINFCHIWRQRHLTEIDTGRLMENVRR